MAMSVRLRIGHPCPEVSGATSSFIAEVLQKQGKISSVHNKGANELPSPTSKQHSPLVFVLDGRLFESTPSPRAWFPGHGWSGMVAASKR